jgi:hypothetical protein
VSIPVQDIESELMDMYESVQKSSSVIRGLSVLDGLSASYPDIRSTDPNSYTWLVDAPNRMARSLILSTNSLDDVTITD